MKHVSFDKDFYKRVYEALCDYCEAHFHDAWHEDGDIICATVDIDEYTVEAYCDCSSEYKDESFDHAFGTWHDPCPSYEFEDVIGIEDVSVFDDDGEVEGFSIDDYYAQFVEDEHDDLKKGDKVLFYNKTRYEEDEYEVVSYNTQDGEFCVKRISDNKVVHTSRYNLKKLT